MARTSITFAVEGLAPAPQGSKRHVGNGVMIESCKQVKPWRYLVTQAAMATGVPLIRGPVSLSVVFLFVRPGGHFRKDGTLKPSAPRWMAVKPDLDKILRSTGDALDKVLYENDSRIAVISGRKRYCTGTERAGALIRLIQLEG